MQTFAELLESLATRPDEACEDFVTGDGVLSRKAGDVLTLAEQRAAQLLALGLTPGERVALMLTNPWDFLPFVHGCLWCGLVAVPMYPPPPMGRYEAYRQAATCILRAASARLLVTDNGLARRLGELPVERAIELDEVPDAAPCRRPLVSPSDLALLQFTSGSTSAPKGVMVTHRALLANAHAIMHDGLSAGEHDRGVSWLPLYHDMGLIGFGLAPLFTRTKLTFIPMARFVRNPAIWLQTIAASRATITFAPNFAYALAAQRVTADGLDLTSMRMWGCGAEPISAATLEAFEARFGASGVKPGQISPCYGLAEATLAVTFTPPSAGRRSETIDADTWERTGLAVPTETGRTLRFVGCGTPLPGYSVTIADAAGTRLPERTLGEIVIQGPSIGDGYFADPINSAPSFRSDGLHTGDLGYVVGDQLFVTGRLKDTIIVNGRNYAPQVIEEAAMAVSGVRLALAANFVDEMGEHLALLIERGGGGDATLSAAVRAGVAASCGVAVSRVVCLSPGSLPKTTSGKPRRGAAKALLDESRDAL